jgi:hypothetical protein
LFREVLPLNNYPVKRRRLPTTVAGKRGYRMSSGSLCSPNKNSDNVLFFTNIVCRVKVVNTKLKNQMTFPPVFSQFAIKFYNIPIGKKFGIAFSVQRTPPEPPKEREQGSKNFFSYVNLC